MNTSCSHRCVLSLAAEHLYDCGPLHQQWACSGSQGAESHRPHSSWSLLGLQHEVAAHVAHLLFHSGAEPGGSKAPAVPPKQRPNPRQCRILQHRQPCSNWASAQGPAAGENQCPLSGKASKVHREHHLSPGVGSIDGQQFILVYNTDMWASPFHFTWSQSASLILAFRTARSIQKGQEGFLFAVDLVMNLLCLGMCPLWQYKCLL